MTKISSLRLILRFLLKYWRAHRIQAILNASTGIASVLLSLAFVWSMKLTVDVATGAHHRYTLYQGIAMMVSISLLQIAIGQANRWIKSILGVRAENRMRRLIFSQLLHSDWMSLRAFHSGDILNRIVKDVQSVVILLTEDLPALFTTILQLVGAFVFLCTMDANLAWLVVGILPLFLLVSKLYFRKLRSLTHALRAEESRVQSLIQESLQHVLVIKTLQSVATVGEKLSGMQQDLHNKVVRRTKYASFSACLMSLGFSLGYLFTFSWGVIHLQQGLITYGALMAFIQLVAQIQSPIRVLSGYVPVFINVSTACERLMELEELPFEASPLPTAIYDDSSSQLSADSRPSEPLTLCVENFSHRYMPESRDVLSRLNYTFPPASITAVLGETGAGKTTLIRSLLALIRGQEGSIYFRLADGGRIPLTIQSRGLFSYVPQGNTLISGTIRENLLLAKPTATDDELHAVLHVAAADFVLELPLGIDTPCTEMGGGFSEGQAQRICIARSLLRDTPVYLFDESTSALDAKTEEMVVSRVIDYCRGKMLIFITHRPAVLQHCTQVLELKRNQN